MITVYIYIYIRDALDSQINILPRHICDISTTVLLFKFII